MNGIILLDHSFVEGSARNINFKNSENFLDFLDSYDLVR